MDRKAWNQRHEGSELVWSAAPNTWVEHLTQDLSAGTALDIATGEVATREDHTMDILVLIVLALTYAGTTWGLGRIWARLPFVAHHRWAL